MATFPGGMNTYVPSWDASGKLQIEFSRNPKSFPVNQYVAQRTVTKRNGLYLKIGAEEGARVVDPDDYAWPLRGAGTRPGGQTMDNYESFEWLPYVTYRQKYDYPLDYEAAEGGDFNALALHGRVNAQKAMTVRTIKALSLLTNPGNWGSNTATATSLAGGTWTSATSTNPYILDTVLAVSLAVNKVTLGVVNTDHLRMVFNPNTAKALRGSEEMVDFIKQQQSSPALFQGQNGDFFRKWALPQYVHGVKVVVEDTVRVTSRKNKSVAATPGYALPDGVVIFTANTQDVSGDTVIKPEEGSPPSFDTITNFMLEDMTVESRDNPGDRCIDARIVDDFGMVMTAAATGYLVTAAT